MRSSQGYSAGTCLCALCGAVNGNTSTKRCDRCWELESRINAQPDVAERILSKRTVKVPSAIFDASDVEKAWDDSADETGVEDWVGGPAMRRERFARLILGRLYHLNVKPNLDLQELFDTQYQLQSRMGFPTGHGEAGLKENLLHASVEIVEALQEINFKPWKTKKKEVDREKLMTELTDILQFWANAGIAMGFTPVELTNALRAKWKVNHQRVDVGDVVGSYKQRDKHDVDLRDVKAQTPKGIFEQAAGVARSRHQTGEDV